MICTTGAGFNEKTCAQSTVLKLEYTIVLQFHYVRWTVIFRHLPATIWWTISLPVDEGYILASNIHLIYASQLKKNQLKVNQ